MSVRSILGSLALALLVGACGGDRDAPRPDPAPEPPSAASPEPATPQAPEPAGAPAEPGGPVTAYDAWNADDDGVRLNLVFDPGYEVFMGQVVNATDAKLCAVRVSVQLLDGAALGPTDGLDVESGATLSIELPTGGASFERWSAEVLTSPCSGW